MSTPNIEIDIDIHDAQWENSVDNIEHTTRDAVTKALSVLIIPHADMEISIVLAGDDFIQELNKNYRGKDKPTNVLSFPMTTPEELENGLPFISLGDVIISFDTIKREASEQNKCFEHHYMHMLVHGCLHLLHYDHEIEEDAIVMESEEIRILEHFGIKNPYEVQ